MSKSGKSLLRGARGALDFALGKQEGCVAHVSDREVLLVEELSDTELEAISKAEVPPEHENLDLEDES